jgi:dihydroorotate dehydrogenase
VEAGAAAVVAKSINESEAAARQLESADYVLLGPDWSLGDWSAPGRLDSLFNRSGLAKVPLEAWLEMLARCDAYASARSALLIGSITVGDPGAAAAIAARMQRAVRCIELNVGAPHGREVDGAAISLLAEPEAVAHCVRLVREAVDCPLIVKLGQAGDVVAQVGAARASGADVVALVGRANGFLPDLETWDPVLGSWAALGGPWSLPLTLYWISKTRRRLGPDVPLVGTNGARSGLDVARFLLSGARAVELASLPLQRGPAALGEVVRELDRYVAGRGVGSLEAMVGVAADRARDYTDIGGPGGPRPWLRHLAERP